MYVYLIGFGNAALLLLGLAFKPVKVKSSNLSKRNKCFTDHWFMVCYPRALLSQANRYWLWQNCTSCVFLPLNMRDIYVPVFWFSLLKVVQQIARGSSSFEKLMFYSIQFHFVSAKMRTITFCWCARKVQIVKVICRVLIQWPCTVTAVRSALTLTAQRFLTQLDLVAGMLLRAGNDT